MIKSGVLSSKRNINTAKPLFTQLQRRNNSRQSINNFRNTKSSIGSRTLPNLMKTGSLDTSKENISYQGYITKVNSAAKIDQKSIVSNYLNSLRKQYDRMAKNSKQKQIQINRMKKEIQFMRRRNQNQKTLNTNFTTKYKNSTTGVRNIEQKHQNVKMQEKTLNHVIDRMKKDQIWHKNTLRLKDLQVLAKIKAVKEKNQQLLTEDQNLHKLQCTLNQMKNLYTKNRYQRSKKYENYCQNIGNLQDKQKFVQQRQQRTYQLLSIEANDILDAKNVLARQVLMANKVCDSILQVKIFSLLKKYENVQNAFHAIKTKTSIADPHLLANKFFSYDQLAQNLMKSIYASQIRLEAVTQEKKRLQAKYKEIAYKDMMGKSEIQLQNNNKGQKFNDQKRKAFQQLIQKELLLKKMRFWVQKNFSLVGCQQLTESDPLSMKFRGICSKLKQQVANYQNKQQKITDRKYTTAGFRVKKLLKQVSIQSQSNRKTEIQQMNQSIQIENKYICENRNMIKKGKEEIKSKGHIGSMKSAKPGN